MSGFAGLIDWGGDPDLGAAVDGMLDRMPHRAAEGRAALAGPGYALGLAVHGAGPRERAGRPVRDPDSDLCVVADARLSNREDLARALGAPADGEGTDAELILRAWRRWRDDLPLHLEGEYGLVGWDARARAAFAARDLSGAKPLYYSHARGRLALASEVGPILALGHASREVDEPAILEHLMCEWHDPERTFFAGVRRLPPGCVLRASPAGLRIERCWLPQAEPAGTEADRHEYARTLRRLACQAVADRMESDWPVVVQVSGGLDSSAIALLAGEVARGEPTRARVHLAAAAMPGMDCDERRYQDAVARSAGLPLVRYDGTAHRPIEDEPACLDTPWCDILAALTQGVLDVARGVGARTLMNGHGGDEQLFEIGSLPDLAAHGAVLTVAREVWRMRRWGRSAGRRLLDSLRGPVPDRALAWLRRARPRPAPAWLGPRLREVWREQGPTPPASLGPGRSHTQRRHWARLTAPQRTWVAELVELRAARRGVIATMPWVDERLSRLMLGMPWRARRHMGRPKRLVREALADLLPPEVALRRDKAQYQANIALQGRRHASWMRSLMQPTGPWRAGPYVDRAAALAVLDRIDDRPARARDWMRWYRLWQIATLERWLRLL